MISLIILQFYQCSNVQTRDFYEWTMRMSYIYLLGPEFCTTPNLLWNPV